MMIKKFETLIRDYSLKQLERVAKLSKDTDIGNRTKNIGTNNGNLLYIKNFNDFKVETHEDAVKKGK